jgi:hypothetical protein
MAIKMKLLFLLILSLCITVFGNDFKLDTNDVCKYTLCKMNNDSAFHQYRATVFAKSKFDSLLDSIRSRLKEKDVSLKKINELTGGALADANNHLTYPIVQRTNEIIEEYCRNNKIDVFIIYPPYGIQYVNGETNDFPDPADSIYIKRLEKCPIPDVTDTLIQLLNNDPKIGDIKDKIDKEYNIYKKKMVLKNR